ncbi:S-layer homology domain-containing protein [Lawsonibacter sp. LCP25S3_G6]|uniref:S-layer homology domain-containing protein n=1 Tax=unclassified Lawsonibacter TaxID=2617946 RepID=UPI003F9E6C95
MLTKKTFTVMFSLALAGTMAVPGFAAQALPSQMPEFVPQGVISSQVTPCVNELPLAEEEGPLTRAELIAALYEWEGKPTVNYAMDYTDVAPEDAYAQAICWATSEGIAGGYGDGTFGPGDGVTREQMAVILYQYAQYNDQGFTGAWAFPLGYADSGEVSEFAYEAVCWVTMKDIMGAVEDDQFAPGSEVTRQEAQIILQQYVQATTPVEHMM